MTHDTATGRGGRPTFRALLPFLAFVLSALLAGLSIGANGQAKVKEKDLPPRHQEWLKLTSTFILPAEREVFLSLPSERDRDLFIEAFWKQRDPTPGTPQNEFREEMTKRFAYVNNFFRRGTVREGWMTDMGRIYMILGPPQSIERFEGNPDIYPTQVWYYYGDPAKNLPSSFAVIFTQRRGGEFRLYNPASEGPGSLIIDTKGLDLTNPQAVYEKIRDLAPTLATVSLSLIPGQVPFGYAPSPEASLILQKVFDSPKKGLNPAYATHFMNYRGVVSTEYLTNYIESSATVEVLRDGLLGVDFVHFAMAPKSVSVDYYEPKDQYYCSFKLNVSLRRGEVVVFQYSKDYPFYFPPDRAASIQAGGISVQDLFPIAEGKFGLTILLQNAVGKEFCLLEREIEVPAAEGGPKIMPPVVGYGLQDAPPTSFLPFQVLGRQVLTDPKGTLGASDELAFGLNLIRLSRELWAQGEIEVSLEGAAAQGKPVQAMTIKLAEQPYGRTMSFVRTLPTKGLAPDYYELQFILRDGHGGTVDKATGRFVLSPAEAVPHPATIVRALPAADRFLYHLGLGIQYDKTGDPERAEAFFRKALDLRPGHADSVVQLADLLVRRGKPAEALETIEALRESEPARFSYHLLKGRALMGTGDLEAAIASLLEANKIYNSDTVLLNALGTCFFRTGRKKEALDALNASLRLNPEQPEIKALVARVEKELK